MESEKKEENKDQIEASGSEKRKKIKKASVAVEDNKKQESKDKTQTALPMAEKSSPPTMGKRLEVIIPSSGESVTEVEIGNWFKKDGEFVKKGEEIVELESEKAI